jgi:hypothetical protein
MAAAIYRIYESEGIVAQWEYDDVSLVVNDLRVINAGPIPCHLSYHVSGHTYRTQTFQPNTNGVALMPFKPTLTIQTNFKGEQGLFFSVEAVGVAVF